jgi:putative methanogenesis marker protein 8
MGSREKLREFLEGIERELGGLPKDLHVTRMCCALVAVSQGKVIKVEEPRLKYCPLRVNDKLYGFKRFDREEVCRAILLKISKFGYFTPNRELCREGIEVPYGASEMMKYALEKKAIDAAVTVCEGAGTIVTSNPKLVQGVGARMTGVFYTTPIPEVIRRVEEAGGHVVFRETARIDQIEGVKKAVELGYRRIAVTVSGYLGEELSELRRLEGKEVSITALIVCTTGMDEERAEEVARYADLVWSCASLYAREVVGREARIQVATKIPVYILSEKGVDFLSSYSSEDLGRFVERGKKYLISGNRRLMKNWRRIKMGDFDTYLGEVDELPVRVEEEPAPLI